MLRCLIVTLSMLAAVSVAVAESRPGDAGDSRDWETTYRDDLQAARRIILENHPGPVDALNPGFGDWLDAGFTQQMSLAQSIDTADEYVYALQKFIGGFRDGHLGIRFDVDRGPARWPGFFATWRNGTVVVHTVDPTIVQQLGWARLRLGWQDGRPINIAQLCVDRYPSLAELAAAPAEDLEDVHGVRMTSQDYRGVPIFLAFGAAW